MAETTINEPSSAEPLTQEQEDFLLAQAIAESEREAGGRGRGAGSSHQNQSRRNCHLS